MPALFVCYTLEDDDIPMFHELVSVVPWFPGNIQKHYCKEYHLTGEKS